MQVGLGSTLLIGGARSGKSSLVLNLGLRWPGSVTLVATATAGDDDMARRIDRHKQERPADWAVIERPTFKSKDVPDLADQLLIVDCVTMLVANLMFADRSDDQIREHIVELGLALQKRRGPSLIVTNEVGLGVHPETELGRHYRDTLGRCNQALAQVCEASWLVVAGKAVPLVDVELSWRSPEAEREMT